MTRLWLMDPGLVRQDGHRLPYALDIVDAAKRRGVASTVVVSREASDDVLKAIEARGAAVEPLLMGGRGYPLVSRAWRPGQFLATLDRLARRATSSDLVCVASGEIEQVAALLGYTRIVRKGPPIVIQMFDWGPSEGSPTAERLVLGWFRGLADRLGRRGIPRRLVIAGQSSMAEQLTRRLGRPIDELPFVVDWSRFQGADGPSGETPAVARPLVGFLGGARAAKGFGQFVDAVVRDPGRFRTVAQAFQIAGQENSELDRQVEVLRRAGCEVHEGALLDHEYAQLLVRIDIVVLPYSPRSYGQRTSGILAEGLGLGKVVVAPRGTWLGSMLEREGSGIVYDEYSAKGLFDALVRAHDDFDRLRRIARERAARWRECNSADAFVSRLARYAGWQEAHETACSTSS